MSQAKAFIFKGVPAPFHHGALAVCRTLGRVGVEVAANDESARTPAARSRYRTESLAWADWPSTTDAMVERLLEWGRRQDERSVLIAVDDTATITIDDHAAELREFFLIPERPAGLGRELSSKWSMAELAEAHGVATARIARIESASELDAVLEAFGLPIVVKRTVGWVSASRSVPSVTLARTREEVVALGQGGWQNYLFQEFIPGDSTTSWMFNGYFDNSSRCLFGLTGYKLRQFPINGGFTTLGRLEANEAILETATEFFANVGYVGIVDVGFRFDARDASYKLLDVNPRVGSTFRLFVDSDDRDVVRIAYSDLTGQPVGPPVPAPPRSWSVEPHDVRAGFELVRAGRTSLRHFLTSFASVDEPAWWARDDAKPFAAAVGRGLAAKARRRA